MRDYYDLTINEAATNFASHYENDIARIEAFIAGAQWLASKMFHDTMKAAADRQFFDIPTKFVAKRY